MSKKMVYLFTINGMGDIITVMINTESVITL